MASDATQVDSALQQQLAKNRERRQLMKLSILASLRFEEKEAPPPVQPRGRRMTLETVQPEAKEVIRTLVEEIRPATEELKLRLVKQLAKYKRDKEAKVKNRSEIERLKVKHEQMRAEMKQQAETIKIVRGKNRRMRRLLQGLQQRLVASTIVMQYQMDRKIELIHRLENLRYYRDTILDNALAFVFGAHHIDPSVPLGGVFGPYAYIDYNEEADLADEEHARLLTLTPPAFKSGAQQRRVSLRNCLSDGLPASSQPYGARTGSIDYSSLVRFNSLSSSTGDHSSRDIDHRRIFSDDHHTNSGVIATSVLGASGTSRRLAVGKGLKSSMSAGPTRHEQVPRKSTGLFSIFKQSK